MGIFPEVVSQLLPVRDDDQRKREKNHEHVRRQYDGSYSYRGLFSQYRYRKPYATDDGVELRIRELQAAEEGVDSELKGKFLNFDGEWVDKKSDLDAYYSSTRREPRRLLVQATPESIKKYPLRHWRHRKIKGEVPVVIKLAEFCLNPLGDYIPKEERSIARRMVHWILTPLLTICLGLVIQILLSVDMVLSPWSNNGGSSWAQYQEYENYLWQWPKHAINPLDQRPDDKSSRKKTPGFEASLFSFPRRLVVKNDETGEWEVKETEEIRDKLTGSLPRYVFLSYSPKCFDDSFPVQDYVERAGKAMVKEENENLSKGERPITAFWLDKSCIRSHGNTGQDTTEDVNNICDAVRGAESVYIVLPDDSDYCKHEWGARLWTLPEALLAPTKMRYCFEVNSEFQSDTKLSLTNMYETFWGPSKDLASREISLLVEHFSGTITLSNIQLFAHAVQALACRKVSSRDGTKLQVQGYSQTEVAYAAMGLMAYRITPDPTDNNFQAIARLSLANDSDQLLERMVCLLPKPASSSNPILATDASTGPVANSEELLQNMAMEDQFDSRLWDVSPLCKLVGVGDDPHIPTVILDQCHATPIRWKRFPTITWITELKSFRGFLSARLVRWCCYWINLGFATLWTSIPIAVAIYGPITNSNASNNTPTQVSSILSLQNYYLGMAAYFAIAWVLSLFAPAAIDRISSEATPGSLGQLVGFEGTMDIRRLERIIFGNVHDRLRFTPSCTPLTRDFRDPTYRQAKELDYAALERNLLPGQRLFTIVDLVTNAVSVIAAERPPTVALICGRDGGMLRALLCSWRFENNCLYRETVMRVRSSMYDQTAALTWVKVSLASQGAVARARGVGGAY
ncbi:hypothetical protein FE257_001160 [Aspergillus nanangensis]|uniref:Heterokaryon incompatibility domain-containing protein n=1 Tax=Aspergillus nanangensis TaxID=2582783 RepID=A0AAD4CVW3_ASPNN|nr:hypothetical protein FE257_001160 [Aspergillus nanangensis]